MDRAIALNQPLTQFLRQGVTEGFKATESWSLLKQTLAAPAAAPAKPAPPAPKPGLMPNLLRPSNLSLQ
jgi:hypothetical protein